MYQERGTVCKAMLALASRLGVPVLALNQINRAPDARAEKRPTLADLADSGQIEQDADIVGLLYRDDYYNANTETPNIIELGVMKNRINGSTGPVFLYRNRTSGDIGDAATSALN
jgi:replicative DNA helicase